MRRLHLFELEDQPWFPATIRDLATDYLHFIAETLQLDRVLLPLVQQALAESGATHIVDLCSGGSGPVPELVARLADRGLPVTVTLTDLYPNVAAFREVAARTGSTVGFSTDAVDARAVPAALSGLRTIFNGFHHFRPEDARAVLHAAAAAGQPVAVFELSQRTVPMLLSILLTPLAVWIATPFMRPFRWKRLLWTYLLPLVPMTCLWDGVVSQLRAYTVDEFRALAAGAPNMRWVVGQVPIGRGTRGRLTYAMGIPQRPAV